jgi:hypothetical protein
MQAYVIMHNMIIENDGKTRARHIGPYEYQGPLVEVDHVPAEFADFLAICAKKYLILIFTLNCNMISSSIYGGSRRCINCTDVLI